MNSICLLTMKTDKSMHIAKYFITFAWIKSQCVPSVQLKHCYSAKIYLQICPPWKSLYIIPTFLIPGLWSYFNSTKNLGTDTHTRQAPWWMSHCETVNFSRTPIYLLSNKRPNSHKVLISFPSLYTVDLVFKEQPLNEWSHLKNDYQGTVNCDHK